MMRRVSIDSLAGGVVVVLSVGVAVGAARFPSTSGIVSGPALFPLLVAALWCPLGIALMFARLRSKEPEMPAASIAGGCRLFAVTLAYAGLMPLAGFVSASALYLVIGFALLGYRNWWRAGALGLSAAFLSYWIFAYVMKVPLPEGLLG